MKRWIASIIALALMCAACALADGANEIDLAALSDGEIVELLRRVEEEVVARHIAGTAELAGGSYIAGRDVPAGAYVYTCMAGGDEWGNVTVYSDGGDGDQLLWEVIQGADDAGAQRSIFISLSEGDRLKSDVPFSLTIFAGPMFK